MQKAQVRYSLATSAHAAQVAETDLFPFVYLPEVCFPKELLRGVVQGGVLFVDAVFEVDAPCTRGRDLLVVRDSAALVASLPVIDIVMEEAELARPCAVI